MKIFIQLSSKVIQVLPDISDPSSGAVVTFSGVVRGTEDHKPISSLFYEAYQPMAENMIRDILVQIASQVPCTSAEVLHRLGSVPVGQASLWVRVFAPHRAEAFTLLTRFLDRLKQEVPIWKTQPSP